MGGSTQHGIAASTYNPTYNPTIQVNHDAGFGPSPAVGPLSSTSGRAQGIHHATVQPGYIPAPNNDFGPPINRTQGPLSQPRPRPTLQQITGALASLIGGHGGGYGSYEEDDLQNRWRPPGTVTTSHNPNMTIGAPSAEFGGLNGSGAGLPSGPTPLRDQLVQPTPVPAVPPTEGESNSLLPLPPGEGTALNPWGDAGAPDISQMSIDQFLNAIGNDTYLRRMYNLSDWQRSRRQAGFNPGSGVDDSYFGY